MKILKSSFLIHTQVQTTTAQTLPYVRPKRLRNHFLSGRTQLSGLSSIREYSSSPFFFFADGLYFFLLKATDKDLRPSGTRAAGLRILPGYVVPCNQSPLFYCFIPSFNSLPFLTFGFHKVSGFHITTIDLIVI